MELVGLHSKVSVPWWESGKHILVSMPKDSAKSSISLIQESPRFWPNLLVYTGSGMPLWTSHAIITVLSLVKYRFVLGKRNSCSTRFHYQGNVRCCFCNFALYQCHCVKFTGFNRNRFICLHSLILWFKYFVGKLVLILCLLIHWIDDGQTWSMLTLYTNLVDPASSSMLVSKIKPCMSQYKFLYGETANGFVNQLLIIWWSFIIWITVVILELIHAQNLDFQEGMFLLDTEPTQACLVLWWYIITERIA